MKVAIGFTKTHMIPDNKNIISLNLFSTKLNILHLYDLLCVYAPAHMYGLLNMH